MRWSLLVIASLGYFVDIVDLFLFNVVRVPSLRDLGVPPDQTLSQGAMVLNWQAGGMLLGSFVWGILGDRRGRVSALYGSITLYSIATLLCVFVDSVAVYAGLRFIAGFGLAGELGAAITLVAEALPARLRGYGTGIVAAVGLCGGSVAAWLAESFSWRTCYGIGGAAGLFLLALRWKLSDSDLFLALKENTFRGSLRLLLLNRTRALLYTRLILTGVPIYFVSAILMVFAPELASAIGVVGSITAAKAIFYSYLGVVLGDLICAIASQGWKSRKRAIAVSLLGVFVCTIFYFTANGASARTFYTICFFTGISAGYWAVLITSAAETFGTNLRATVTTTVPNLIRASTIGLTMGFQFLVGMSSVPFAVATLGALVIGIAAWALLGIPETFGRSLDFTECASA